MNKQAQTKAENFINNAERLKAESRAMQNNIASVIGTRNGILNGISDHNTAIDKLRNRAAGGELNLDSKIREQEERRDALKVKEKQAGHDLSNANDRLSEVTLEREALGSGLSQEDVLAFFDIVRETEERLPRLRVSIDQQRTIEREAREFENRLLELEEQREDLLAAYSIGEATQKEIDAINAAITQEEERLAPIYVEAEEKIVAAEQTSMGLTRLLEEATRKHACLLEKRPLIIAAYLRSEGASIGKQYVEAAEILVGHFKRLVALDRVCKQLMPEGWTGPGLFARNWRVMHIPALHSESENVSTVEHVPHAIFATSPAQFAEKFCFEAAREIEQELAAAGISDLGLARCE